MTIEEMIREKQERGYSYAMISEYSGVPVPTIQKIFSGETKSPRYDTLCALQDVFEKPFFLRESQAAYHAGMKDMPVNKKSNVCFRINNYNPSSNKEGQSAIEKLANT